MTTSHQYTRHGRLLTVENLAVKYGPKVILRNINLHIDNVTRPGMSQGQVVSLLGPSGIGKTQLFRCLAGLQQPTEGKVSLNGDSKPVVAGAVGVVFQNYPLMEHRTIMSNLQLAARELGAKAKDAIGAYLDKFALADKAKLYPSQLSGGQRQRVSIIQQLLCSEHFILMDEPFSGLDILNKRKIMDLILQVSTMHEDNTIIITTHDIDTAVAISDTIWLLGREKDASGNQLPGAIVVKELDLIERDLAWTPDVEHHPNFAPTVRELKDTFASL